MKHENILFLDIETASACASYSELDSRWQSLFQQKIRYYAEKEPSKSYEQLYQEKAAIFAEFGKIICIGIGSFRQDQLRIKCLTNPDERALIGELFDIVRKSFFNPARHSLCGHNIREFDMPYLCRRAVKYAIELPDMFKIANKKAWQVSQLLDTMDYWKFGDSKNYTSLDLLAAALDLSTSKSDMDGSQVNKLYYEGHLQKIAEYCMRDVWVTVNVFLRLTGEEPIDENSVQWLR